MERIKIDGSKTVVHDPNYVEFAVLIKKNDGNEGPANTTVIGVHKCNHNDYAKYHPRKSLMATCCKNS